MPAAGPFRSGAVRRPFAGRRGRAAGLLLCALLLAFSGGCIRETLPECPPLQITLTVKDRNYFNIDDAVKLGMMERVADDLPFRRYVHSLYYVVHDEAGRTVAEQRNIRIRNNDATQSIVLPASLPYGRYTLTVWGNMDDEGSLGAGSTEAGMESSGTAANDIYLACATFDYRYGSEIHTLGMERTKGNLLIRAEGIPDNIDFSTKTIAGVFGLVDNGFSYSELTDVQTELDWTVRNEIQTQTLVCPSPSFEGSTLSIEFIDKSQAPAGRATLQPSLSPRDVNITMGRNEITILRYVYREQSGGDFDIYLRVNDNWELLHSMGID